MGTKANRPQALAGATDISADGMLPLLYTNPETALASGSNPQGPGNAEGFLPDGCDPFSRIWNRGILQEKIALDQDRGQRTADLMAESPQRVGG